MLALFGFAAAATLAAAAPAVSSLPDAAGPVTTGVFSAVSSIQSFATPLIPSGASVASGASSVFSGGIPTRSFATSASFASSMGNMSMPTSTQNASMSSIMMMSSASMASSTATGVAGGVGVGSNSSSSAACSTSTFPASATSLPTAAPTGQVIQGDYSGKYRPQVHFSPPKGFMNDPNGCHRDQNGTYHLYYQYNPFQYVAGNQHWGHATSQDLYNWTNQPIAIFPPNSTTQVFSGSAVLDPNNTSGFFPNQTDGVVAVYTLNSPTLQVQEIAYSRDGGYSFTPYDGNPVLDVGSNQFRDPKVFWYQDHWVMAVAYANDYTVGIFTSQNLSSWEHQSNFTHYGLLGLAYECPNLIEVPFQDDPSKSAWVMFVSINPGAPLGGSVSQYFIGDFDGKEFKPYDSAMRLSDFAKDNYAGQWFADTDSGDSISIAWASNWQYTQSVPTADEGFRSAMSLPRRNYLTNLTRLGWDLVSLPYDLSPIVDASLASSVSVVNTSNTVDFSSVESNSVWFSLNVSLPDAVVKNASLFSSQASLNITFLPSNSSSSCSSSSSGSGSQVPAAKIVYFYSGLTNGAFALERPAASSLWGSDNPFFSDKFSYSLVDPLTSLEGVFDRSLLEVFLNEGAHSATMLVYPDEVVGSMKVETQDMPEGTTVQLTVNGLKSTWQT